MVNRKEDEKHVIKSNQESSMSTVLAWFLVAMLPPCHVVSFMYAMPFLPLTLLIAFIIISRAPALGETNGSTSALEHFKRQLYFAGCLRGEALPDEPSSTTAALAEEGFLSDFLRLCAGGAGRKRRPRKVLPQKAFHFFQLRFHCMTSRKYQSDWSDTVVYIIACHCSVRGTSRYALQITFCVSQANITHISSVPGWRHTPSLYICSPGSEGDRYHAQKRRPWWGRL